MPGWWIVGRWQIIELWLKMSAERLVWWAEWLASEGPPERWEKLLGGNLFATRKGCMAWRDRLGFKIDVPTCVL